MDHIRILRRSLQITWVYRALWVFGILLAITAPRSGGNGGGNGGGGGGSSFTAPIGASKGFVPPWPSLGPTESALIIGGLILLALIIAVVFTIARYVSETSAIRMVDGYEETTRKVSVAEGFRLGWNRAALRMFLMDLMFTVGVVLLIAVLVLLAFAPLLALTANNDALSALGTTVSVLMIIMVSFLLILIIAALTVLIQFMHRAIVLEGLGVFDSIRRGWAVVRRHPGDVLIMALILFGLGLASVIVILPVLFILMIVGGVLGGVPGLLAGLISSLFLPESAPVIVGMVIGAPIFLLVVGLPMIFLDGLTKVFTTSTWTLTYRELVALDTLRS